MRLRLHLPYEFVASHALPGFETPHDHLWRCRLSFEGSPVQGKIADLPRLEAAVSVLLSRLPRTYLNDNAFLSASTRQFPTCEGLATDILRRLEDDLVAEFRQENPSFRVASVSVSLCDPDGREWGTAEALC